MIQLPRLYPILDSDVAASRGYDPIAAAEDLILQPGFNAELLYNVPKPEQGSWVSLAVAPNGDLVAGDQGGVLWHVSLKDPAKPVVTKIDTKFFGCHGLLFAHGALYACTSEKGKGDIWRLRDTKGDGSYAEQTMLRSLKGSGEHGPHQLVLDRDGSILVVGGNHAGMVSVLIGDGTGSFAAPVHYSGFFATSHPCF